MNWQAPVMLCLLLATVVHAGQWQPLMGDGLHDPDNPALNVLQNPSDALSRLPADSAGNKVDWVRALEDGYIRPRSGLKEEKTVKMLDTDIQMNDTGSIPRVLFPHKAHTKWLDCGNCHEHIFKSKAGATPVTMSKILEGEYCGVCHGAVAFPLTECNRCHSVAVDQ
jgi:c(7)-type cytochrome triheme protein